MKSFLKILSLSSTGQPELIPAFDCLKCTWVTCVYWFLNRPLALLADKDLLMEKLI